MKVSPKTKQLFSEIMGQAGITLNGPNPFDIQVHNDRFYSWLLRTGTLGAGESYMAGDWDCERIDQLIYRLLKAGLSRYVEENKYRLLQLVGAKLINHGKKAKAFEVGQKHYDIGNDLYSRMLDKRMIYSCGYWKGARNLDEAQNNKLDLICKKLMLQPGMRVLDIGGGWGGLAKYMAEYFGVSVVTVSVSKEQVAYATESCQGLPVEHRLMDYRDLNEPFDRIVSVGMFEHVGPKNYREYMKVVRRCLKDDGLFLLHTIFTFNFSPKADPWGDKYIFPNGVLPSMKHITSAAEGIFHVEDVHCFGEDYAKTLWAWYQNFEAAWPELKAKYGEAFYKMWRLYLLSCKGMFEAHSIGLTQVVLSPKGVDGGYVSVR